MNATTHTIIQVHYAIQGDDAAIKAARAAGVHEYVADVRLSNAEYPSDKAKLERVWALMQNTDEMWMDKICLGVHSRAPPNAANKRGAMHGDAFVVNGRVFVVGKVGFRELA
ncbi:hypothetical protein [Medusavirus stheno T3]|uniref:Uncharacterized protein n=1 Tax=Medusavirus stheno T3 TaxID=3069717 RepID=A0A7S7YFM2_9VIRU|nr:hypothetical protein QKU73_gp049 [Acanthamoeba castellanii medusavirus]QPB44230.1 hypothetical protein [Medusavirus stheno T3]